MILKNLFGKEIEARLTRNHIGIPVLVVNSKAYSTRDVLGWKLVSARAEEREALKRAGYTIRET